MPPVNELRAAKDVLRGQLLQLGLGGNVTAARATISVAAAVRRAGRNVHAVGIGRKKTEGKTAGPLCVRVYVVQKLPESLLSPRDVIPATIDGIDTDVIEAAPAYVLKPRTKPAKRRSAKKTRAKKPTVAAHAADCSGNRRKKQRPVVGGISAGHRDITAGTLGCFCRSTALGDDPSRTLALSNNHVFADVNSALIGDPLYQPGPADGGGFADHFANLERYVPIKLGGNASNKVDAAVGALLPGISHEFDVCSIGGITGTMQATEDMLVRKHGRTTGLTDGIVDDIDIDPLVGMDHDDPTVVGLFENQLRIVSGIAGPIGLGGDSGSVVFHKTQRKVVGLYFAGPDDGSYGLANHIDNVLTELQIELI